MDETINEITLINLLIDFTPIFSNLIKYIKLKDLAKLAKTCKCLHQYEELTQLINQKLKLKQIKIRDKYKFVPNLNYSRFVYRCLLKNEENKHLLWQYMCIAIRADGVITKHTSLNPLIPELIQNGLKHGDIIWDDYLPDLMFTKKGFILVKDLTISDIHYETYNYISDRLQHLSMNFKEYKNQLINNYNKAGDYSILDVNLGYDVTYSYKVKRCTTCKFSDTLLYTLNYGTPMIEYYENNTLYIR